MSVCPAPLPSWLTLVKNTTREQSSRLVTFETFECCGDMTWLTKRQRQRRSENTLKRLVTFETLDQNLEETSPDQQKYNDKDKDKRLVRFYHSDQETWSDQNRHWQWQWHFENTLKEQSQRFMAFQTLITFLTIENNNLNIHITTQIFIFIFIKRQSKVIFQCKWRNLVAKLVTNASSHTW